MAATRRLQKVIEFLKNTRDIPMYSTIVKNLLQALRGPSKCPHIATLHGHPGPLLVIYSLVTLAINFRSEKKLFRL